MTVNTAITDTAAPAVTANTAFTDMVELRCPDGMGKLLARTARLEADGVVELACNNCARALRATGRPCARVLHRFNLLGELLATDVVPHP